MKITNPKIITRRANKVLPNVCNMELILNLIFWAGKIIIELNISEFKDLKWCSNQRLAISLMKQPVNPSVGLTTISTSKCVRKSIQELMCKYTLLIRIQPYFRAKEAVRCFKKRFQTKDAKVIALTLELIDVAMQKCGNPLHI